jgi:hypothetical protein
LANFIIIFVLLKSKKVLNTNESMSKLKTPKKNQSNIESSEIDHLRFLIKNQSDKIKAIINKTEKLKGVVSI